MLSRKEKTRAFLVLAISLGVWQSVEEWTRLLSSFLQWEMKPTPPDMFQLGVLNAFGNGFHFAGALLIAQVLDTAGVKAAGLLVTFITGLYHIFISQTYYFITYMGAQSMRSCAHFLQISDAYAVVVADDGHEGSTSRAILKLSVPLGIAMAAGPALAGYTAYYMEDLRMSIATAGCLLILVVLPLVLFALPEIGQQEWKKLKLMPSMWDYKELLRSHSLRWALLTKFLVDVPYQAFESISRQYLIFHMIREPSHLAWLFMIMGLSTLFTSLFLVKFLHRYMTPQQLLMGALSGLVITYLGLSVASDGPQIMMIMPLQVMGISIVYSELTGKILSGVDRRLIGKAAGMSQMSHLLAGTITPLVSGYLISTSEFSLLCYGSAIITAGVLALVYARGQFLNARTRLPSA